MDAVTIKLGKPVEVLGKTYSELTFREATTGDACATDAVTGEFSQAIALLASIADVPIQVIKALPLRETKSIMDKVTHLMGNEPTSADTGSKE